jgi:hypothetical protein
LDLQAREKEGWLIGIQMLAWKRHAMKILSKTANGSCSSVCFILRKNRKKQQMLPSCNGIVSKILEK